MNKKFTKTEKIPLKRIYISYDLKIKAQEICQKYKVSLSTLVSTLANETFYMLYTKELSQEYLQKETKNKTYIKPRNIELETKTAETIYMSNLLYLFIYNKHEEIFNYIKCSETMRKNLQTKIKNIKNKVYNKLTEIREIYYDLNNIIRTEKRALTLLGVK